MYRWEAIKNEFGTPINPPSTLRGRTRIIGLAALTAASDIYRCHLETYLDELHWWLLIHHDIDISISALQDTLAKAGLTRKLLHKVARERDELQRADYLAGIRNPEHFSGTGEEFVTVDESSKNEFTLQRRYGRSYAGQQATMVGPFVRGTRYSLCAALSLEGYIASRVIEGSYDSFEFFDFIVEDVVCPIYLYSLYTLTCTSFLILP